MAPASEEEGDVSANAVTEEMMMAMARYMPLRGIANFGGGRFSYGDIEKLVEELNSVLTS